MRTRSSGMRVWSLRERPCQSCGMRPYSTRRPLPVPPALDAPCMQMTSVVTADLASLRAALAADGPRQRGRGALDADRTPLASTTASAAQPQPQPPPPATGPQWGPNSLPASKRVSLRAWGCHMPTMSSGQVGRGLRVAILSSDSAKLPCKQGTTQGRALSSAKTDVCRCAGLDSGRTLRLLLTVLRCR